MNVLLGTFAVFAVACVGTALYLVLGEDEGLAEAMVQASEQPAEPPPPQAAD